MSLSDVLFWVGWLTIGGAVAFFAIGGLVGGMALSGEKGSWISGCLYLAMLYAAPAVGSLVAIVLMAIAVLQLLQDCAAG